MEDAVTLRVESAITTKTDVGYGSLPFVPQSVIVENGSTSYLLLADAQNALSAETAIVVPPGTLQTRPWSSGTRQTWAAASLTGTPDSIPYLCSVRFTTDVLPVSSAPVPTRAQDGTAPQQLAQVVNIQNANLDVTVSGGSLDVNVQNATIDVTASSALPVEFPNAQQVNVESGNVNSNITNEVVPSNTLVPLNQMSLSNITLLNGNSVTLYGDTYSTGKIPITQLGLYDGLVFVIYSEGGYNYDYDLSQLLISNEAPNMYLPVGPAMVVYSDYTPRTLTYATNGYNVVVVLFDQAYTGLFGTIALTNNTGSTITGDTITVNCYGIRAQVQVNNTTTTPVNNAPVPGQPFNSYSQLLTQGTPITFTELLPSGGTIQALHISIFGQSAALNSMVVITNGNNGPIIAQLPAAPASSPVFYSLYFGNGVANNGIYGYLEGGATGDEVSVTTFGVV